MNHNGFNSENNKVYSSNAKIICKQINWHSITQTYNNTRNILGEQKYKQKKKKPFMVVKRDGRRQPFDIKKIAKGIERALEKRPVSTDFIDLIVNEIEDEAYTAGKLKREISTEEIGELVLKKLNSVDKVAYIRFASVYRHFTNLEEFITEVKKISES